MQDNAQLQNPMPIDPIALMDEGHPVQQPQQEFNNQQPINQIIEPTRIFKKSATHFNVTNAVQLLYSIMKLTMSITLLCLLNYWGSCQLQIIQTQLDTSLQMWTVFLAFHSLLTLFYYLQLVKWMAKEDNCHQIAFKLGEVVQQQVHQDPILSVVEESRKISILSMQIKYEVQKSNCCSKLMGRICFVIFQVLFVWGLFLFLQYYQKTVGCEIYLFRLLIVVLFLGIYQYIDFYIILLLVVICSPFLVLFCIYYLCSLCQKNVQQQQVLQALQSVKYRANVIEGDAQCSICYSAYELEEEITILRCSNLHHFHTSCIKAWIRVSRTCPLCRKEVQADQVQ